MKYEELQKLTELLLTNIQAVPIVQNNQNLDVVLLIIDNSTQHFCLRTDADTDQVQQILKLISESIVSTPRGAVQ